MDLLWYGTHRSNVLLVERTLIRSTIQTLSCVGGSAASREDVVTDMRSHNPASVHSYGAGHPRVHEA